MCSSDLGSGAGWSDLSGETAVTHVIAPEESGVYERVRIRASNSAGTVDAFAPAAGPVIGTDTAPTLTTPSIAGTAVSGQVITATSGTPGGSPFPAVTYQWESSSDAGLTWTSIAVLATGSTYTLQNSDVGALVRVTETATNRVAAVASSSTSIGPVQFPNVSGDFSLNVVME